MSSIVNKKRDTTAQIEQYIGTSYDKVAKVADNLDLITELADDIDAINNAWQVASENPTARPDGSDLEDGDRYYNDETKITYVFSNGDWVNPTAITVGVESFVIDSAHLQGNDTVIALVGNYTPNQNAVEVHVNGVFQYSQSVDSGGAYVETDANTITFPNTILTEGERVTVAVGTSINTVNPIISVTTGIYIGETVDQLVIPLPEGMEYTPSASNLEVHINGQLLFAGLHYAETSPTTISVSTPLQPGDEVIFKQGDLVGNSGDTNDGIQQLPTVSVISDNLASLDTAVALFCKGGNTIGDGSGGSFVYDPTANKADANGVTQVDATTPLATQGEGIGNGCWVRQYERDIHPAWFNTPNRGMAALRSLRPLPDDRVTLDGFYENSTAFGGTFVWDHTMDSDAHDGGTIISPEVIANPGTAAWFDAPEESVLGCWVRMTNGQAKAGWWGLDPDVVEGDVYHILAQAAQYEYVEVAVGTYEFSADSLANDPYSYGNVNSTGAGSPYILNLLAGED